ncbi:MULTISPECIES: hypothetical protein [Brenneria]|uniref:hypothetical protein n=1 Tax=Brenneria TaxID=71655 RepID=UPI0003185C41|nr:MULTISPECIES: hypothetical protein [Brenneria]
MAEADYGLISQRLTGTLISLKGSLVRVEAGTVLTLTSDIATESIGEMVMTNINDA